MIDIQNDKIAREPIAVILKEAKLKTHMNMKLHQRLVDFQLFDIERGDM